MKRMITLLILLLAGPSLASATTCLTGPECFATSGSMVISAGEHGTTLTATGPEFQMSGLIGWDGAQPGFDVGMPIREGGFINAQTVLESTTANDPFYYAVSIDVRGGVHLDSTSDGNFARTVFQYNQIFMPGPGIFSEPFSFRTEFQQPAGTCATAGTVGAPVCWEFFGQGILTLDVVATDTPGFNEIREATFTFNKPVFTPEPSTASLLLIAFAGLAVVGHRRRLTTAATPS